MMTKRPRIRSQDEGGNEILKVEPEKGVVAV